MQSLQHYIKRLELIVGDTDHDGQISLDLRWTDYASGKALIMDLRRMQKEIRLLKKEVLLEQSQVRSQFMTTKATVGHGVGSVLGGALFGRKAIGRVNAARRDDLRTAQHAAMQPYENLKQVIDKLLATLDQAKGKIELSPEYQNRTQERAIAVPMKLPPPLPTLPARDFFLFLNDEVKGPFTIHQIEGLISAGLASDTILICPVGSEEWISLYEAPELETLLNNKC